MQTVWRLRAHSEQSVTDLACERLRSDILGFALAPGAPLIEEELAKRLQLSRTPIREALRLLEREGLVQRVRNRGATVADVSLAAVLEAYEIREHLEAAAARKAAANVLPDQIAEIRTASERLHPRPESTAQLLANEELDRRIHSIVLIAGGNRLLRETAEATRRRTQRVMFLVPTGRYAGSILEHHAIADALESRDPDAAERAMRLHLRRAAERLHGYFGLGGSDG